MTMTHTARLLAVVVALAGLAACADADSPSDGGDEPTIGDLQGRTFTSTAVTVGGEPRPLVDGTRVTLSFDNSGLSLDAGCNQLSGQVRLDGDRLWVDSVGGTEMGCQPASLHDQDAWLAAFLDDDPTYVLDGDTLTLTSGDAVIELASKPAVAVDLVGTQWRLDGIVDGSGPEASVGSVPDGVTSTLRITDGDRLELHPGCNLASGNVEVSDDTITVGPLDMTDMGCDDPTSAVEASVLAVLQGDVAYAVDGDRLTLSTDAAGLVYRAT